VFEHSHRHREVEQLEEQARVQSDLAAEIAMNALLQTQPPSRTRSSPTAASAVVRTAVLRRKCACGASHDAEGDCAECKSKKHLQAQLIVGASNDPLELEADRVADQVLSVPTRPAVSGVRPQIQRSAGQSVAQGDIAPASVDRVLASSGRPLEPTLRQDMERRFGYDFSQVRVHSGAAAEQSAREVSANAYAVGQNIIADYSCIGMPHYDGIPADTYYSRHCGGTTEAGGAYSYGTVFELEPTTGGGWTETVLYSFNGDGMYPYASLIFDASGNLYGTTYGDGSDGKGTLFEILP
jgi:uncharacterized repeat protein (TIGR03803 family)